MNSIWQSARAAYRGCEPPPELEASLLARFGQLRRQQSPVAARPAQPAHTSWWHRAFAFTRVHPAYAGAATLCAISFLMLPLWIFGSSATRETTTPFMLVAEPSGNQINVAQLVRVSVSREAMLDFGIPVPPQKLDESVRAEMLLGQRGELLAVRFVDPPARKRFLFD